MESSWKDRCANLLSPDTKCHIIGSFTIIVSAALISISIVYLTWEDYQKIELLHKILQSDINKTLMEFVTVMTLILSSFWIIFSFALIIGILKNYIGLVLCYFVYGIFIVISFNLGALLLLLHQHWIIALVELVSSVLYIRILITVYNVYDLMQRGKVFGSNEHNLLEEEAI